MSPLQAAADPAAETQASPEALGRLQLNRYSCRGFKPEPLPRALIETMLKMAQRSPSWCNSQPWRLHVTTGEATERVRAGLYKHALADAMERNGSPEQGPDFPFPAAYRGVYKDRQREVGWQLYESVGIRQGDRAASGKQALENFRFFGAPHMLVITTEQELGVYGAIDCGLYMANLALAAQSLGVGIILQAAIAMYSSFFRQEFGIPDNRLVIAGASFGYADDSHPANSFRSTRADVSDVVTWVDA